LGFAGLGAADRIDGNEPCEPALKIWMAPYPFLISQ